MKFKYNTLTTVFLHVKYIEPNPPTKYMHACMTEANFVAFILMSNIYIHGGKCTLTLYRPVYLSVIRELKKGLCIHANTSGSDSPTDPKLGSFSRNRMLLPGHSWLLRNCLSTSVRRRKSGSNPAVFSETSERKGHAYIREPPTPELGVFSAKTTPKVSSRPHPKGHRVLKSRKKWEKIDLFKKWEKIKISAPLWCRLYGFCWGGGAKTDPLFAKKHVLSPCLGTSPWVGRFCSKVHTKHNGSKSCIFATLVGKGLILKY